MIHEFDTSLCQKQNVQYSLSLIVNVLKSLIWFNDFFGKRRLNSLPRSVSLGSSIYNISICDIGVISASAILMTHNVSVFSIKNSNSQNINNDQINVQCALLVRSKIKPGDFFVWIGKLEGGKYTLVSTYLYCSLQAFVMEWFASCQYSKIQSNGHIW